MGANVKPDMWGHCPACDTGIDYVRWGEGFNCPKCATLLKHTHDCEWDSETETGDCYDYLELVTDGAWRDVK